MTPGVVAVHVAMALAVSLMSAPASHDGQAGSGQAGTPPPTAPPPPSAAGPDNTTATYGDWTLRCTMTSGASSKRSCEIVQSIVLQGQTAPLSQLAIGRMTPGDPLYFTAVLPTNVTFPSTVRIALDERDKQPVELAWTRCLPTGCFASLAVTDPVLKRWRVQDSGGRLIFKNGAGQDVSVPISFRGLGRALDALQKDLPVS